MHAPVAVTSRLVILFTGGTPSADPKVTVYKLEKLDESCGSIRIEHHFVRAVRQYSAEQHAAGPAIPAREIDDFHEIAWLQCRSSPAAPAEVAGTHPFETRGRAIFIIGFRLDDCHYMRVAPLV